jgi:hypothetical protein
MADTFRYLYGENFPVVAPVLTAQAVAIGDLVGLSSGNVVRAEDETWIAAPSTPSAPTVAASAATRGTALTNALTGVKVSANYPWGEGDLSAAGTATPTAAFGLKVTLAALPTNALSWNVYVEDAAGSGTYKLQQVTTVSGGIIYVDSYGTGRAPAGAAPTATQMTQYNFAQRFLGVSQMRKPAAVTRVTGGGADNTIVVSTEGVYKYDCASATFAVGDLVGPAKDTGNALLSQTVAAVADATLAIGRVVEAGAALTSVKVKLFTKRAGRAASGT